MIITITVQKNARAKGSPNPSQLLYIFKRGELERGIDCIGFSRWIAFDRLELLYVEGCSLAKGTPSTAHADIFQFASS
jgi:hypothetical protein